MVQVSLAALLLIPLASAAPLRMQKRIAQVIADSTAKWEAACIAAGGAAQCNPISQTAFTSLLAAGGNCDQQNAADSMIDLAKTLGGDAEMIRLSQLFVQQPRNAPDSLQVPYCQTAPKNAELNGLFHCQFEGSDFTKFSGDQTGNLPLGLTEVNPAGSCPAKTDGPVPDGVQLNTLASSGTDNTGSGAAAGDGTTTGNSTVGDTTGSTVTDSASPATSTSTSTSSSSSSPPPPLKFSTLTADSACTAGESACVNGGFAQCVGGKFTVTQCAGGTQCFALPLVNSAGTSITCSTEADKDARIAATGASA
ncbi:hypothetical protein BDZ89DRAFT_1056587 [Hymenopellis radicata]|nr:hypothetical protein BDZ89DRAFT_1056587 [Hymenopellis radicata]